jgi:hypothetical protein
MSGPVDMGRVHSFLLFVPAGVEPPPLPWREELHADNPKLARWIQLDGECHGDGKVMPRDLYALVCDGRDPDDVIHAFRTELVLEQSCDEALLVVHRHEEDGCELYTKNGAPLLLAAARTAAPPSLLDAPLVREDALRELVEKKFPPKGKR